MCVCDACTQKKGVCVEKLHREMRMIVLMHERHERAFSHARACVFECLSFMHCVCGLHFHLCFVCVPPFSKEGGDVVHEKCGFIDHYCRDVLDSHVFVVVGCVGVC